MFLTTLWLLYLASFRHRPLLPVLSALSFSDNYLDRAAILRKGKG